MEKSTRKNVRRIITVALIAVLAVLSTCIATLPFITRAPAYATAEDDYKFTVDTGSYTSGSYIWVGGGATYPVFTLQFDGNARDYGSMAFWYGLSDTDDIGTVETWTKLEAPVYYDADRGTGSVHLDEIPRDGAGGIIHKYMFFRGGLDTLEEYWVYGQSVEIGLDINSNADIYKIDTIGAVYSNGMVYQDYDYQTENATWVSSPVTFTVSNNGAVAHNAKFYYQLRDESDPTKWREEKIQFTPVTREEGSVTKYYGEAVIPHPESGIKSYSGEVKIFSTKYSDDEEILTSETIYLNYDAEAPSFTVSATFPSGTEVKDYVDGSWASRDVTFKITSSANNGAGVLSGATYSYYLGSNASDLHDLRVEGSYFTFVATESCTVTFVAKSKSGVEFKSREQTVKIDKNAPEISVKAVDANGTRISSFGEQLGAGTREGYASDRVTFTLTNAAVQENGNEVRYYYRRESEADYSQLSATNGNFILSLENGEERIIDRTYYFKAVASSGLESEKKFTVTVLDSLFYTNMEIMSSLTANTRGWLKDVIKVRFTMPAILDASDFGVTEGGTFDEEYRIVRYKTGKLDTKEDCKNITVVSRANGFVVYEVGIDMNLDNESVSYEVVDKANNTVTVKMGNNKQPVLDKDGSQIKLATGLLRLHLDDPQGVINASISGSTITLTEDDWSASEVSLSIVPEESLSGVYCYPMLAEGVPSLIGLELINGAFSTVVSASGVYSFRLESGAGRYTDLSFRVNIDSSSIKLDGVSAETTGETGKELTLDSSDTGAYTVYTVNGAIANDVRVKFDTNHTEHFVLYVGEYNGTVDADAFKPYAPTSGDPYSYLIKMPEEGGSGTYSYAFKLVSKAKDSNGNATETTPVVFVVSYDVRDFNIGLRAGSEPSSTEWRSDNITFELVLESEESGIEIAEYQVSFGRNGTWQTIEGTLGADYSLNYEFTGLTYYVDEADKSYAGEHKSYNGVINFRALNKAGKTSNTVSYNIRMDRSSPNPLYALVRTAGEMLYDSTGACYNVYSKDLVYFRQTDSSTGVFANKAPITYFYRQEGITATDNKIDAYTWVQLGTSQVTFEPGKTYWIYAQNAAGTRNATATKVTVFAESTAPTAVITSAGNKSAIANTWEFAWVERADIYITVNSQTAVYFWYKCGSGEWTRVSENPVVPNGGVINNKMISFSGADSTDEFTIVGNMKETVRFKITNLSGWDVELTDSVVVKIDTLDPEFTFDISTPSVKNITETDLATTWYPEAVTVKLISTNNNPSGVVYTYKVDGSDSYEHMRGTFFSTDDIVAFTGGNGTVTVTIRAQSNASAGKVIEKPLTFMIDKLAPDFELVGKAIKAGVEIGTLSVDKNGETPWTNADEVRIQKKIDSKNYSVSDVAYTYWFEDEPTAVTNWDGNNVISVTNLRTVWVKAVNKSGLSVTKSFAVKIDNEAPIINAGRIVQSEDPSKPNRYYIDQSITWVEHNLKSAKYNNYPLTYGQTLSTANVDNSNGGLVHIVIEDFAGNKAELTFYMTVFDLTVNTITLSEDDKQLLNAFEQDYLESKSQLDESRSQYFSTLIGRLKDRLAMLQKQIDEYQGYLEQINKRVTFDLVSDYSNMKKYIDYFISEDDLIRYPVWQQEEITKGVYAGYYQKLKSEYEKLDVAMETVRNVQKAIIALPATNIVERGDYEDVIRVYNQYVSLTPDQKAVFKSTLYNKLVELKRLCEIYLLQDEDSGVMIDGDNLVGETAGAWLSVTEISSTSEKFKQAQASLYSSFGTGEPTKIITIHQLTLEGYGSQYKTNEITITIPIPSAGEIDYASDYVYFGVYRLASDGSIIPMSGSRIAPDGKSVSFKSTELGTYILATAGNVVPRPADTEVYGSIAGVEIDATLLTYITFAVIGMFVIFVVVVIIIAVRRNRFLRSYNRDHKNSLVRRGITRIPKGNAPPASNPARPEERVGHEKAVYYKNKR